MTDEERLQRALLEALRQHSKEQQKSLKNFPGERRSCLLDIEKDKHDEQHQFVESLMEVADRLERIKWGFFGSFVKSLGMFFVGALIIGLVVLARSKGASLP